MNDNYTPPAPDEWEILIPLVKGGTDTKTGKRRLHGVATDESIDLDREIVKASGKPGVLDYLKRAGGLNWDHGSKLIGRVTDAHFITPSEADRLYGRPITGTGVRIEGELHPLANNGRDPEGLVEAHRLIDAEHPLFFSIQGTRESSTRGADGIPVTVPGIITQVAVTPQPKNTNAFCVIAKSMSQVVEQFDVESDEIAVVSHDDNGVKRRLVYTAPEVSAEVAAALIKSEGGGMVTSGAVPGAGTTGADAAKRESLDGVSGQPVGAKKCCGKCRHKLEKGAKYCGQCGHVYKSLSELAAELFKAVSPQAASK